MSGYGFHFSQSTLALTQGANDPRREHFRKLGPVKSIVRELAQNSLDAKSKASDGPVRIVFELKEVRADSLPDYENLCDHIRAANDATIELAGPNKDLQRAADATACETFSVLRVSDYNTTGLSGSENDVGSPLSALTRTSGVSVKPTGTGGSFGIGSAAGAFNSRLLTVFWTTVSEDRPSEVVFAGRADLASHQIGRQHFDATGIFLDRDSTDAFKYLRNSDSFLGFEARKEPGTDTYIPAYVGADSDPNLLSIRDSFAENFFASLREGHLQVEAKSGDETFWKLNQSNIATVAAELDHVSPYYDALDSPPIEGNIEGLGNVKLHVNLSPALTKRYHTALMRTPLMVVNTYEPRIRTNYAAVFICDNPKGNELLRSLEPPTHDDWVRNDPDFPEGKKVVGNIRKFIRDSIHDLIATAQGDEIRLEGLKELLPSTLGNPDLEEIPLSDIPSDKQEAGEAESSTVHGDPDTDELHPKKNAFIKPRMRRPGDSRGDEDALGGNRSRRKGSKKGEGGTKHTKGGNNEGAHSIADSNIQVETWFDSKNQCFYVAALSEQGAAGSLTLCAQGDQGTEEDFDLEIQKVVEITANGEIDLQFEGNTIQNLSLSPEKPEALLRVHTAGHRRLRLGVI